MYARRGRGWDNTDSSLWEPEAKRSPLPHNSGSVTVILQFGDDNIENNFSSDSWHRQLFFIKATGHIKEVALARD
jgi:hypothetical protein